VLGLVLLLLLIWLTNEFDTTFIPIPVLSKAVNKCTLTVVLEELASVNRYCATVTT